jgi:hypothetical protein
MSATGVPSDTLTLRPIPRSAPTPCAARPGLHPAGVASQASDADRHRVSECRGQPSSSPPKQCGTACPRWPDRPCSRSACSAICRQLVRLAPGSLPTWAVKKPLLWLGGRWLSSGSSWPPCWSCSWRDARAGHGPVGKLIERFNLIEYVRNNSGRIRDYASTLGAPAPALLRSAATTVAGIVTIFVLSYLMVLEEPRFVDGFLALFDDRRAQRIRRVSQDCAKTITGYISGNLRDQHRLRPADLRRAEDPRAAASTG